MSNNALVIRGLVKRFAKFTLGPLDVTVPRGAIYGFIGPNGAGKTTTIDLVMGMGRNDAGTIAVFGLDHARDEVAVKARVGYVSPDLTFAAWGRVGRAIAFVRSFYPDWDDAYCADLMKRFNLSASDAIGTLSFGSRTKLNLVIALAHRPALLLLDEPLSGLDPVSKREVFAELLEAVQDEARTVFISSHNLDELERFCDHIGIIDKGQMLLEGPTSELVERFAMVDCTAHNGARTIDAEGVWVQRRDGDRWRLLLDTKTHALDRLHARGLTDIATTPVTLEELFVAMMKRETKA
ncbi:MAG: ABC transporter ATP-binding protein [Candidatus Hydrogenedentes bacterium]|nr:ABC transporter ATP-binding protein [Candidatus Hydrogenedentota bacterium]